MKWKAIKVAHDGYDKYIRGYIGEFLKWKYEPSKEGDYFYIEALEDNTYISIYGSSKLYSNINKFEYSFNKIKWYKLSSLPLVGGKFYFEKECDRIYLRNISGSITNSSSSSGSNNFFPNYVSTPFKIGGDLHTVMFKYTDKVDTLGNYAFSSLFSNSVVVDASDLVLPAATVGRRTYYRMFSGSSKLKYAPKILPAISFSDIECYREMFKGCNSLVESPKVLSATTLTYLCCNSMFENCTSLTTAPELPATTLASNCYNSMFKNCSSLVNAPELPATELHGYCYYGMFQNCYSLIEAPKILPATILVDYCYYAMFYNCTSLNKVVCLATDISSTNSTNSWLHGVSSTGTFYKHPDMNDWSTGTSGIPSGWEVIDYTE